MHINEGDKKLSYRLESDGHWWTFTSKEEATDFAETLKDKAGKRAICELVEYWDNSGKLVDKIRRRVQ